MPEIRFNYADEVQGPSPRVEWARTLGMIINNTHRGYWLSDSDTEHGYNESYDRLRGAMGNDPQITLSVFKGELQINDEAGPLEDAMIQILTTHMEHCDISDFSVASGLDRGDYGRFLDILAMKPLSMGEKGGFVKLVTDASIPEVRVLKVVYKRVAENETVISHDALKAAGHGLGEAITRQIMELLGGNAELAGKIDALLLTQQNPRRWAELILESVGQDAPDQAGQAVVDNIRRAFDRMMADPSMKTQKGKKALARMLTQLESELVSAVGADSQAAKALHDAMDTMQDELQMESISAEYAKKRKAIEASEQRILRYMKAKGLDQLVGKEFDDKLVEMGLSPQQWGELIGKSGLSAGASAPPPVPGAAAFTALTLDHLTSLIDHIEHQLDSLETRGASDAGNEKARTVATTITDATRDVHKVLAHTEDKVRTLVQSVQEDHDAVLAMEAAAMALGQGPKLSRRRMIEILAEVVQEICQPLAVINCSLDLVLSKALGEVASEPLEMLRMAKESADRTMVIVEQMKDLSGMPVTRTPDQQILGNMYTGHGPK